jgi:hypothetical protein
MPVISNGKWRYSAALNEVEAPFLNWHSDLLTEERLVHLLIE